MNYLEVYNETLKDLLQDPGSKAKLIIGDRGVTGLNKVPINNPEDIFMYI